MEKDKRRPDKLIIFDMDDTISPNMHDYTRPKIELAEFILKKLGYYAPWLPDIITLQENIDRNLAKTRPSETRFAKDRFPTSFKLTYQEILDIKNLIDEKGEKKAYKIGTKAFDKKKWKRERFLPGAKQALTYLRNQGHNIVLLTKGDREVQEGKIKARRLDNFFGPRMFIVPEKTPETIDYVINQFHEQNYDKRDVYHVGNSARSDIIHAIDAQVGAIYIPLETWSYEKDHKPLPEYDRLVILQSMDNLPEFFDDLKVKEQREISSAKFYSFPLVLNNHGED